MYALALAAFSRVLLLATTVAYVVLGIGGFYAVPLLVGYYWVFYGLSIPGVGLLNNC